MRHTSSHSFVGVQAYDDCPGEQQKEENEMDLLVVLHVDNENDFWW